MSATLGAMCSPFLMRATAVTCLLGACGTDHDEPEKYITTGMGLEERHDRRMAWDQANLSDYTFVAGGIDGQLPFRPIRVTVRGKAAVGGVYVLDQSSVPAEFVADLYTIDSVFDLIDQWVMNGVYRVDAFYDPVLSFPIAITSYPSGDCADCEYSVTASDLMPLQDAEQLVDDSGMK